ncbi:hypothetical protein [Peribacillus phoenicis]|uniref:hypothetical protein n=1 Tax=unclassified Peribacillus TaxID=2675266 RepID=UPI00399F7BFC
MATSSRCDLVRRYLKNSLDFVNIMMGYYSEYLNFEINDPSDVHNIAYWYIRKGDIKVGGELLNTLDIDWGFPL